MACITKAISANFADDISKTCQKRHIGSNEINGKCGTHSVYGVRDGVSDGVGDGVGDGVRDGGRNGVGNGLAGTLAAGKGRKGTRRVGLRVEVRVGRSAIRRVGRSPDIGATNSRHMTAGRLSRSTRRPGCIPPYQARGEKTW